MGICICKVDCSNSFPATMLCPVSANTVKVRSGMYVDRLVWIGLIVVDLYKGVRAAVTPAGEAERGLRHIANRRSWGPPHKWISLRSGGCTQ